MNASAPPTTLPRLLAGMAASGPVPLAQHLQIHGPLPALSRRRGQSALALITEIERSGLRGCGGAAFPTAAKLTSVAASRGRAIVVANGCEGEPTSLKDRLLLERLPHLVIDGALIAAHIVEANEVVLALDESSTAAVHATNRALRERPEQGRGAPGVRLVTVPSGYVSGQEAAVVNFLGGGPAKPMAMSSPIYQRGVKDRPTLLSNVETLAHIALIARHGAEWYRALGTPDAPGSTLVTLGGAVAAPGVFEIERGTSIASLLAAAGGPTAEIRAFLIGGYAGTWVAGDLGYELNLSPAALREAGASLGPGVLFALPDSACPVSEVASVARWLASQSAGQCGPCIFGLDAIAGGFEKVRLGAGGRDEMQRIARWASLTQGRGACAHPDGASRFITSATRVFAPELAEHARRGPCRGCLQRHLLPAPARPRTLVA